MINVHKHHPVLQNRLKQLFEAGDGTALLETLNNLSAADFRTAGYLLADNLLSEYPQHFWQFFLTIVPTKPKAYLGTFLKACIILYRKDNSLLNFTALQVFANEYATPIDEKKCLEQLIPALQTEEEVERLLDIFQPATAKARAIVLLKAGTPISYYLLFKTLQTADENNETLRDYCLYLMKKGDSISFNMAVILRSFFDLPSLPGTFSLKLEPYQLSRLNESYENFYKLLVGDL